MSAEPRFTSSNLSDRHLSQRWSRRELLVRGGGGLLAAGLLAGCQSAVAPPTETPTAPPPASPTAASEPTAEAAAAIKPAPFLAAQPAAPTLEQMLAQMVMVGFRGTTLASAAPIVADISQRGVGSVVLFSYDVALQSPTRNVESPAQLAELTGGLQALTQSPNSGSVLPPLLIAAERGDNRMKSMGLTRAVSALTALQMGVSGEAGIADALRQFYAAARRAVLDSVLTFDARTIASVRQDFIEISRATAGEA